MAYFALCSYIWLEEALYVSWVYCFDDWVEVGISISTFFSQTSHSDDQIGMRYNTFPLLSYNPCYQ